MSFKKLSLLLVLPSLLSGCFVVIDRKTSTAPTITPNTTTAKYTYKQYCENYVYPISSAPCKGEAKLLIIPIWFSNSSDYISLSKRETVREDIYNSYFGSSNDVGWESVSSYYKKDSFNNITITGEVSNWYECEKDSSQYFEDEGSKTALLVVDAVEWYKSNNLEVDMSDYDKDRDGYLDGVVLIYASPDYQALSTQGNNMWAYCYWTSKRSDVNDPTANVFFWASYDFMYDSKTSLIKTGKTGYGSGYLGNGTKLDTHTYIHEMGHVFGLEDYYDYAKDQYLPAGGFSMQDYNLGAHDPFSRFALGWSKAIVPTQTSSFLLKKTEDSGEIVILSNSFSGSPFEEYIILELYTPSGLNELDSYYQYAKYPIGPKDIGVRIWHIDARIIDVKDDGKSSISSSIINGHKYMMANNNTSSGERVKDYLKGGPYRLNQLIRNDTKQDMQYKKPLQASDLFKVGDTFSVEKYAKQFTKEGKMNDGTTLNWTVHFDSINNEGIMISCYKTT